MPRPLRVEYPGAWYYVVQWGDPQLKPFKTASQKALWLTVVQEACQLYGLEIHAYCLFDSHYHLLIHTPKQPLSPGMRHINSVYTQRYQLQTQKTGSLFKNRYKSVLLDETAGYVQRMGRFIHRLPLLYRFKEPLFKFSYSSYPAYIQEHPKPEELRVSYLLSYHAGTHKLKSFYDYTESAEDNELVRFYKKKKWASQLGNPQPTPQTTRQDLTKTIQNIKSVIDNSSTLLWNGPLGYFENPNFSIGSLEIAKYIGNKQGEIYSVIGGGDTVSVVNSMKIKNKFNFVSTAGGAFLEYLEGKILPGIRALN